MHISWTPPPPRAGWRGLWDRFIGPGATGAELTIQLLGEMKRRGSRYGLVTMCIGGGMGAAGIFENLQN